jgi:hypothetical protein
MVANAWVQLIALNSGATHRGGSQGGGVSSFQLPISHLLSAVEAMRQDKNQSLSWLGTMAFAISHVTSKRSGGLRRFTNGDQRPASHRLPIASGQTITPYAELVRESEICGR